VWLNHPIARMTLSKTLKTTLGATSLALATAMPAQAADEVNVAFFLEWATPNLIAKAEKMYEDAMGVPVNWTNFDAGTQMTEAMLSGDIDISYSQGLAPFITAVNANAPIKTVGIAVAYPANPCIVASGAGITKDNASELEGKTVAVPLATMADYSFRMQMRALDVDLDSLTIVDQVPADGAVALAEGSVDMACLFVVSVTDKFAAENPDVVRAFMEVTDEINKAFAADQSKLSTIVSESGMDEETTINQMSSMVFPTIEDQMNTYFNDGGLAGTAVGIVGNAFASDDSPALEDYSAVIDTSFIE